MDKELWNPCQHCGKPRCPARCFLRRDYEKAKKNFERKKRRENKGYSSNH